MCGRHGQHVANRVGLVLSQGEEIVLTLPLPTEGRTVLGKIVRQRAVSSLPALVSKYMVGLTRTIFWEVMQKIEKEKSHK